MSAGQTEVFGLTSEAGDREGLKQSGGPAGQQSVLLDARSYRVAQVTVRTVCEAAVSGEPPVLSRADSVAAFWNEVVVRLGDYDPETEGFWVLCLHRKNRLKMLSKVTSGTATASLAHPREVFRLAVLSGACALICVHNHPSGDPSPSSADVQLTRKLRDAAETLDISLLDHVVIGRVGADPLGRGYYSFREAGLV